MPARGEELTLDWRALADPHATLAVYRGKAAAPAVAAQLIRAGLAPDTPVVLVGERQPARGTRTSPRGSTCCCSPRAPR